MGKCIKELIKEIKNLEDTKASVLNYETGNYTSTYQNADDRIKIEYSFSETRTTVRGIDSQISKYKHLVNMANATVIIPEIGKTIDECLVEMAQLNKQIILLDMMSRYNAKTRRTVYSGAVEYTELNYSLEECKAFLAEYRERVQALQIAIDRINLSYMIEV